MKYIRKQTTSSGELDGELFIIDVQTGKYYSLNPVANRIWEILETEKTTEEVVNTLLEEYDIDKDTCHKEVKTYIEELKNKTLINEFNQ
jgi:hypothetical protein